LYEEFEGDVEARPGQIKANPITVPLTPPEQPDWGEDGYEPDEIPDLQWTGRVIFCLGDDGLTCFNEMLEVVDSSAQNSGDGTFCFYCGPERPGGLLDDTYDGGCYEKMKELFADLPIDVGAAENYHAVKLVPGLSAEELWGVVKAKLTRSGAIEEP